MGQVLLAAPNPRRLNIVMMGMGEPLPNLPEVIRATRLLADPKDLAPTPPDHAFDLRHHPEDRRAGPRAGAAQARRPARGLPRLPAEWSACSPT